MHFSPRQALIWATVAGSIVSAVLLAGGEAALPLLHVRAEGWPVDQAETRRRGAGSAHAAAARRSHDVAPRRRSAPHDGSRAP